MGWHTILFLDPSLLVSDRHSIFASGENIYVIFDETSRELDIISFQIQQLHGPVLYCLLATSKPLTVAIIGMHDGPWLLGLHKSSRGRVGRRFDLRHPRGDKDWETHTPAQNRTQMQNSEEMFWGGERFNTGRWTTVGSKKSSGKFMIIQIHE